VVELHRTDYLTVIDQLADAGFAGGIVFDALIVSAARESAAEQIVTLNPRHFHRIAADLVDRIMAP
jgi:hypothetical protein